jgi:hypothetical protein
MGKVVIFSSHAHVLPFVITETIVADCIYKSNHQPLILRPTICTCQSSYFYKKNTLLNKKICHTCRANYAMFKNSCPKYLHKCLSWQIQSYNDLDEFNRLEKHILSLPLESLLSFEYKDVKIGRIALFDIIIKFKLFNINLKGEVLNEYTNKILDCILVVQKFAKFISTYSDLDTLVVYNSHYSVNRSVFDLCKTTGIKTYSLHNGPSFKYVWDTLQITKLNNHETLDKCIENWGRGYHKYTLNEQQVNKVEEHINELFDARSAHVYSSSVGSKSHCIEKSNKKVILITTSSADEILANVESHINKFDGLSLFENQLQWLKFIINKSIETPEISFIIRVHPREFPNKRDGVKSEHARILENLFHELPDNIKINWPADNVSFYDLIPHVDLVLTLYSSAGFEASVFGCPIILPLNPICSYSILADTISKTEEEYWADILKALDAPWQIGRVIKSFRWMWLNHFAGTISLESSERRNLTMVERLANLKNKFLKKLNCKKIGPLFDTSTAYHCQGWQISQRKINVKGESLISKQLLNHENISDDFTHMHYPLNNNNNLKTVECAMLYEEKSAVLSVLSKMFATVGRPKKWVD